MTSPELAALLAERWPELDRESLVFAIGFLVPLVHVPPRGVWGTTGPSRGRRSRAGSAGRSRRIRRSTSWSCATSAAFGPATVMDVQAWSGLTRLRPVLDRLRPQLATFRDDRRRELFDLPDAPRPDPETPAPPRFLPEYDNVLIGHADRSRIIPAGRRIPLPPGNGATRGTFLLDGMFAGEWRIATDGGRATLAIEPFEPIAPAALPALHEEGTRCWASPRPGRRPGSWSGRRPRRLASTVAPSRRGDHGGNRQRMSDDPTDQARQPRARHRPGRDVERPAPLAGRRPVVRRHDRAAARQPVDGRDQGRRRRREPQRAPARGERGLRRLQRGRDQRPVRTGHRGRRRRARRDRAIPRSRRRSAMSSPSCGPRAPRSTASRPRPSTS